MAKRKSHLSGNLPPKLHLHYLKFNAGSSFLRQIGIGDELFGVITRMPVRQDLHRLELDLGLIIPTERVAGRGVAW